MRTEIKMAQPNGCIGIKGRSIQMGDEPMADWTLQNCRFLYITFEESLRLVAR